MSPLSHPLTLLRPKPLLVLGTVLLLLSIFGLWSQTYGLRGPPPVSLSQGSAGWAVEGAPLRAGPPAVEAPDKAKVVEVFVDEQGNEIVLGQRRHANATFVVLARNADLFSLLEPMQNMEDRFNHWGGYDYVFLNDESFSEEFKARTSAIASTRCQYGLIPKEVWNQPEWIDEEKATAGRAKLKEQNIIYAESISYRNMCRFNAGFYYNHPLMLPYRYAWRFEPEVKFFCDMSYDPFLVLEDEKKLYGFTVTVYEFLETIPTLWAATLEFIKLHPEYLAEDNSMDYISDDGGKSYNGCHFWTNFEIVDMDFWRGEAYSAYFDFLDRKGGFYYERWGDAPIHSIAIALFAPKDSVKFFSEVGYQHTHVIRCPVGPAHEQNRCSCKPADNFDTQGWSCLPKWKGIHQGEQWFGSPF